MHSPAPRLPSASSHFSEFRPEQKFCYNFALPLRNFCSAVRRPVPCPAHLIAHAPPPPPPPPFAAQLLAGARNSAPCFSQTKAFSARCQQRIPSRITPPPIHLCDSSACRHHHPLSLDAHRPPPPNHSYINPRVIMSDASFGDKRRLTRAHSRSSAPGGSRLRSAQYQLLHGLTACRAASTT